VWRWLGRLRLITKQRIQVLPLPPTGIMTSIHVLSRKRRRQLDLAAHPHVIHTFRLPSMATRECRCTACVPPRSFGIQAAALPSIVSTGARTPAVAKKALVHIIYYSTYGHVKSLVDATAKGLVSAGVDVKISRGDFFAASAVEKRAVVTVPASVRHTVAAARALVPACATCNRELSRDCARDLRVCSSRDAAR